jgi:hypothetical protein
VSAFSPRTLCNLYVIRLYDPQMELRRRIRDAWRLE